VYGGAALEGNPTDEKRMGLSSLITAVPDPVDVGCIELAWLMAATRKDDGELVLGGGCGVDWCCRMGRMANLS
jgi:hypothetical protein